MPVYTHNGQVYNIPEDKSASFEKSFPEASISYVNEGSRYDIPLSKRDGFLQSFPSATLFSMEQEEPVQQPEPAQQIEPVQQAEPQNDTTDLQFNDEPDLRPLKKSRREEVTQYLNQENGVAPETDTKRTVSKEISEDPLWFGMKRLDQSLGSLVGGVLTGVGATVDWLKDNIYIRGMQNRKLAQQALNTINEAEKEGYDLNALFQTDPKVFTTTAYRGSDEKKLEKEKQDFDDFRLLQYIQDQHAKLEKEGDGSIDALKKRLSEQVGKKGIGEKAENLGNRIIDENTPTQEERESWSTGQKVVSKAADLSGMVASGFAAAGLAATGNYGAAAAVTKGTFAAYGVSAMGSSIKQAKDAGATDDEAMTAGLASGAIMYLLGKVPMGKATESIANAARLTTNKEIAKVLASGETKEAMQSEIAKLVSKMYGKEAFAKDLIKQISTSTASFSAIGGLEAAVPLIYQDPDEYPVLSSIMTGAAEGALDGLIMGTIMAPITTGAQYSRRNKVWKEQGFVGWTETNLKEGQTIQVWDNQSKSWKTEKVSGSDVNPRVVEIFGMNDVANPDVAAGRADSGLGNGREYVVELNGRTVRLSPEQYVAERTGIIPINKVNPKEVKIDVSRQLGEEAISPEDQDYIRQEKEYTERKAEQERQETGIVSEETQFELDNANATMDGRRAAVQEEIQSRIGKPFWMNVDTSAPVSEGEGGPATVKEDIVRSLTYADGSETYIVGDDGQGNYAIIKPDGTNGFITQSEIDAGLQDGTITNSTTLALGDYLDTKVSEQDAMAEQERMAEELAQNLTTLVESVQRKGEINIGTTETKEMAPVVDIDPVPEGGVMVKTTDGEKMIPWQQVADAMNLPFQPKTTQEIVESRLIADLPQLPEGVHLPEENAAPTVEPVSETPVQEQTPVVFDDEIANNLQIPQEYARLDNSGRTVVDTKRLWEKDPAKWAEYNDADPNQIISSKEFLTEKVKTVDKEISKVQKDLRKEALGAMDQDKMDAYKGEIAELQGRRQTLSDILERYNQPEPVAEVPVEAPMSVPAEQAVAAEPKGTAVPEVTPAQAEVVQQPVSNVNTEVSKRISDILSGKDKKNYSEAMRNHKAGDPEYPEEYYDEVVRQWDAYKNEIRDQRDVLQRQVRDIVDTTEAAAEKEYRDYKRARNENVDEVGLHNATIDIVDRNLKNNQEYQDLMKQINALDELVSPAAKEKFRQNAIGMLYTDYAEKPSAPEVANVPANAAPSAAITPAQEQALEFIGVDPRKAVLDSTQRSLEDIDARAGQATTENERIELMREKAGVIKGMLDELGAEHHTVTTREDILGQYRRDGASRGDLQAVEDMLEWTRLSGEEFRGFHSNGKVYVIADDLVSAMDGLTTYVHEDKHLNNRLSSVLDDALLTGVSRAEMFDALRKLTRSHKYDDYLPRAQVDEILANAAEIGEEYGVDAIPGKLREAGIKNEKFINFVQKDIEDGRRKSEHRTLAGGSSLQPGGQQVNGGQNGRNPQPESGNVGGQGIRLAEGGPQGTGSGEVQPAESGEPARTAESGSGSVELTPRQEAERIIAEEGISSVEQAARVNEPDINFSIATEGDVENKIREFAKSEEGKKLGWTENTIEGIIGETADLIRAIHSSVSGNKYYDEWAEKRPTVKVDWRDGVEKPTVTWSRANIEYKYDMSADLLCINNEGLETVLSSPTMADLMLKMNETTKEGFTSDDYLRLYETLRDMGFVVPCKGCFDAAMRFKMLPSVSRKFVDLVNKTIDERNKDPKAFDDNLRAMAGDNATESGLPSSAKNKEDAVRVGVAGDDLTEHISWTQLMSAEGQTKALSDWGGIFRAWQRTGAGRPKDKLLPEPWSGDIVSSTTTIIGKYGEKTPSYRDINVNQGTGLRRNSHSEFRPLLAIDEIQFMREAYIRGLTVFKYMKELDDVRLFGNLGVKFNMSFFPAFVEGSPAAGLDANGNYIAAEESVGGREYEYIGEDGKTHYDGMKGWQEAQKYLNKDVSLSSVVFSVPHLIKALTDVPTASNPTGMWGSLIPFHASGATAGSLKKQGLGNARALGVGHPFEEAFTDYDKGVTNFEAVQNDRFGNGWVILEGKKAGTAVDPGHKLEFANGTHYYNEERGLHLFPSFYIYDSELKPGHLDKKGNVVASKAKADGHPFVVDYNDKVREIGTDTAYQDAADYYINTLRELGLVPRFDFEVPEGVFLEMCEKINVDPNHPKLGWKGPGNYWSPVDSEAYYSLFCDYGMIDPATGKWAPHNPVGVIDENGNRVFRLPENTIDIIKDGIDRYSTRKDQESERIFDAIEEFAKRSVAEGKLNQDDVEAILADARQDIRKYGDVAGAVGPESEASGVQFSIRSKEDPKKTQKVYKLMRLEDGDLHPLFIDRLSEPIELGKWYDADSPAIKDFEGLEPGFAYKIDKDGNAVDKKVVNRTAKGSITRLPNVSDVNKASEEGARWITVTTDKSGNLSYHNVGINGSESTSTFAMRPGWHAGSLPTMRQIGKGKDRNVRDDKFVWVEGEVSADVDYNEEAQGNPGKDIPTHIPTDGYYMKATNANKAASQADRVGWYVAGAFKPNRIIGDNEAKMVIDQWNREHPDAIVEYDWPREGGRVFNAKTMQLEEDTAGEVIDYLFGEGEKKSVDARSEIKRIGLDEFAKSISEDKGALNIKTKSLSQSEIETLYRRVAEYSNGDSESFSKRADEIYNLVPENIGKTELSSKELSANLKGKSISFSDGIDVLFTNESINKLQVPSFLKTGAANAIEQLMNSSKFAYARPEYSGIEDGHKVRRNVIEYRNYVTKFNNGENEYFCRFTVERFCDARIVSHGAGIKEVEIMEKSLQPFLTALAQNQPLESIEGNPDTKLLNYFVFARTGQKISEGAEYDIPIKESTDGGIMPSIRGNELGEKFSFEDGVSVNDASLMREYGLSDITMTKKGDVVTLNKIVVTDKKKGNGTRFMEDLVSEADSKGWTLALTPDDSFGASSVGRLKNFYKRFGFKENKGRNTDFTINESMVRRPEGGTRFSIVNQTQNGFVSNAEASLDRIKMEKATPEQWVKMLEKEGGLKAGEDKWLGLSDWLNSQDKKSITKQEIADYIAENRIQIEEVDYEEVAEEDYADATASYQDEYAELVEKAKNNNKKAPYRYAYDEMADYYGERFYEAFELDGETIAPTTIWPGGDSFSSDAIYFLDMRKERETNGINPTRLTYTTDGLDNKREIALTVPTIEPWNQSDKVHFGDAGNGRAVAWIRFGDTTIPEDGGAKRAEFERIMADNEQWYKEHPEFAKYGIGDEAMNRENDERTARQREALAEANAVPNNKRVLVIDEIQSKRHQEGREHGYKKELTAEDTERIENARTIANHRNLLEREAHQKLMDAMQPFKDRYNNGEITRQQYDEAIRSPQIVALDEEYEKLFGEAVDANSNLQSVLNEYKTEAVPSAPFEKNWHELAMKRMLRLAAEEGYDYVAWTTGDQQAKRYDIGKTIESIVISDQKWGRMVELLTKDSGTITLDIDGDGNITQANADEFEGKKLSDVVGKELSERIMSAKDGEEISGEGLRFGGEGMKGFYDDILPRFMNKYGKKWGVKVSDITLPNVEQAGRVMHAVPVTPEMKESVMRGQTMFSIKGRNAEAIEKADESGLAGVIGDDATRKVYTDAFRMVPPEVRGQIADIALSRDLDFRKATNEYVGKLAEGGTENDETGLLRVLYDEIRQESGNSNLRDEEIRYMLWRNAQERRGKDDILSLASETAMKRRFGLYEPVPQFSITREFGEKVDESREKLGNTVTSANEDLKATTKEEKKEAAEGDIRSIVNAMRAQKTYDRATVSSVIKYAKELLKGGSVDTMTRTELTKLLTLVGKTTGKSPVYVDKYADQMVDAILNNVVKKEKAGLDKLIKVKDKKVDKSGVEVMGRLDKLGQISIAALRGYKDSDPARIDERLTEVSDQLSSNDDAIRENAWAEYAGLELAKRYHDEVKMSEEEADDLERELKEARQTVMSAKAYREFVKETTDAIRENKIQRVESMQSIASALGEGMKRSIESAREFRKAKEERIEEIHHDANRDLMGTETLEHRQDGRVDNIINNSFVRMMLSPLATFDQMLRQLGRHSVNGEGYLWNRYMRGWVDATENAFVGFEEQTKILDDKVSEVFGKKMIWSDLYDIERKLDKEHEKATGKPYTAKFIDGGEMREHELTSGNLLYIYMVNKMTDGRMKLRKMGITQEDVDRIKAELDPRFIQLADWLQDEYFVTTRNKYNAVHEQLFGAPMAAIENYFPLKINKMARVETVEPGGANFGDNALPSTTTGAIVKRRTNSLALDVLNADAFSVVIEHLQQMEDWAAFAPLREDMKSLLSYKTFRNKVMNMKTVYGSGEDLWNNFRNVVDLAAGVYKPKIDKNSIDKIALNVAKGVTGAKIAFRVQTALKQMLSAPAFLSDADLGELVKSLSHPKQSWNWCWDNLPVFRKRWKSRIAGDTRLEKTDSDWETWNNEFVQTLGQWGMTPNAFVDAMTVSIGAKAMYETKLKKYKELGLPDDVAERRAKQDATILYNQTQQSNEGAFVSAMQKDRTFLAATLSTYRNSSMGYTRQFFDAIRNYSRMGAKGRKDLVEFATRQRTNEGANEEQARQFSEKEYEREKRRNAARIAVFGFVLPFFWNLGVGPLLYTIFGKNKKRKEKILHDVAWHTVAGPIEGLAGGNILSEAWNLKMSGGNFRNFSLGALPAVSDTKSVLQTSDTDPVKGVNQIVDLVVQSKFGVNPQTVTDVVVAIMDASNGDLGLAKEMALLLMRVTQFPQSAIEDFYFDEIEMAGKDASKASAQELIDRYAEYKVKRSAPITGFAYSDEEREKKEKSQVKTIKKKLKERQETE